MIKTIFAGSGMALEKCLEGAVKIKGISIPKVYVSHDQDSRIEAFCRKYDIDVDDISRLKKGQFQKQSVPSHDYFFSVNSTILFPSELLELPKTGALNMHPGRLPDYAGLHTHQWAIRKGEKTFASTLHWMTDKVDAGPIAFIEHFDIKPKETGISLFIKCLSIGASLVVRALETIASGDPLPDVPQDLSKRRVYKQTEALDGRIDWNWKAQEIECFIRALDYGFFVSPTSTPLMFIGEDSYVVQKATIIDVPSAGNPGEILQVTPGYISIRTGDGYGIAINKMKDSNSNEYQKDFHKLHFLKKGMVLRNLATHLCLFH